MWFENPSGCKIRSTCNDVSYQKYLCERCLLYLANAHHWLTVLLTYVAYAKPQEAKAETTDDHYADCRYSALDSFSSDLGKSNTQIIELYCTRSSSANWVAHNLRQIFMVYLYTIDYLMVMVRFFVSYVNCGSTAKCCDITCL